MYITINIGNKRTIIAGFTSYDPASQIFSEDFVTNAVYNEQLLQILHILEKQTKHMLGIGIAHTGELGEDGKILSAPLFLEDYNSHNLMQDLTDRFTEIPMYIENDSACATIAEAYYGRAKDALSVGSMYLSAGIGGSYLKKIDNTYSLFPAEMGHQIIALNGKICTCGQRGCLEAYVGSESIQKRFRREQTAITDERIWQDIVTCMAIGAANLYTMFYPTMLIITGETIDEVPFIRESLVEKIRERIKWDLAKDIPITLSTFGKMGPSYGALALQKIKNGGNTIQVVY